MSAIIRTEFTGPECDGEACDEMQHREGCSLYRPEEAPTMDYTRQTAHFDDEETRFEVLTLPDGRMFVTDETYLSLAREYDDLAPLEIDPETGLRAMDWEVNFDDAPIGSRAHEIIVRIYATEEDEAFTDQDLADAVDATLHEIYPVRDYPTVPVVVTVDGLKPALEEMAEAYGDGDPDRCAEAVEAVLQAWRGGAIEAAVERSKREILSDIESGRVPAPVATFSDLHDYVDANTYGGLCDEPPTVTMEDGAAVQERVHQWLVSGRKED